MPKVSYIQKCLLNGKQRGVIFMEDLSAKMQSLEFVDSMNVFQIKNIVNHLACFHAHLMETESKWRNKFYTTLWIDEDFLVNEFKMFNAKVIEDYPEYAESMQKLGRYMYNIDMVKYSVVDCCKDIEVPSLVQLGDLYTFNITFERQEDNIPNKVLAFFDFQQAFEGNPAFDMARLIAACTDADIRRHIEEFIFDYYYEKLTKYMAENKKKPGFTVDQFKTAYNYALINQATWVPMMAMVALSGDVSDDTKQARIAKCTLRARLVLEDAVKRLEALQPTWINGA